MTAGLPIAPYLLLLGLGFFFGLAFEEFHGGQARPGGVRTFPLLALAGALLYRIDPGRLVLVAAGLLILGAWLACYYWRCLGRRGADGQPSVELMVPTCNLLAYLLGPIAFIEPPWVAIGATVAAVLLLTGRERLHGLARRLEVAEIVTAGKFLILTGLVLPFLPDVPVTHLTALTPRQVWLAVLAVCTVSYASYLLQRYVAPHRGGLWAAVLGGLYSSTATTVVLARRTRAAPAGIRQAQVGIIVATAVMYLRLLIVVAMFDLRIALALAPTLVALTVAGLLLAGARYRLSRPQLAMEAGTGLTTNPLELSAALIFAGLFVIISLASAWVHGAYGNNGLYVLAAAVGATDIDPFVLSVASGGASLPVATAVAAILIAASSNNLLKAAYAAGFAGIRTAAVPAASLVLLALGGAGAA